MKRDFKVLEWLRDVRDRHARQTEGLTTEQRLAALEQETREWNAAFFRNHPEARLAAPLEPAARVAETRASYGKPRCRPKRS
jgi:hypothetical protein